MFDLPRADWYPETGCYKLVPPSKSSCNPRPALAAPLEVFRVHYIGDGTFLGRTDDAGILTEIENYARGAGKPNEYNSGSGLNALACEYAGGWQAAHASGHNATDWGHVVFLGHPEIPTDAQADRLIAGVRRTRAVCVNAGYLTRDHYVGPHNEVAAAGHGHGHKLSGTPCPGVLWENKVWWSKIAAPLTDQELGLTEEDEMTEEQVADIVAAILETVDAPFVVKPPAGRTGSWLYVQGAGVRVLTPYDSRDGDLPSAPVDVSTWDTLAKKAGL